MSGRSFSPLDHFLDSLDRGLRASLAHRTGSARPSPAEGIEEAELDARERRHVAGLMRINHAGEVAAQALYQSQALTARDPAVAARMQHAADEEIDHLAWCGARLEELGESPSRLTPLWYGGAFAIGTAAGLLGDRWNLGFVAETERQVCRHLEDHMQQLPPQDARSRAVVQQMHKEESEHGSAALAAGGAELPAPVQRLMWMASRVMTTVAYRV
jgi:ubiquinone biosynthesis monooxygenase Coq7